MALQLDHRLRDGRLAQPRRHRRRLRRRLPRARQLRPRHHPVRRRIGRRAAQPPPGDAGVPARVDRRRPAEVARRALLLRRSRSPSTASTTTRSAPAIRRTATRPSSRTTRRYAVFGSVDYAVTEALELRGGLRYTKDKKDFVADRIQPPPFSSPFIGRRTRQHRRRQRQRRPVGHLCGSTATSTSTPASRRASARRRSRAGCCSATRRPRSPIPRRSARSRRASRPTCSTAARASRFSVFHYEIKDQQLTAVGGTANFNQLVNADKTVGHGLRARPAGATSPTTCC